MKNPLFKLICLTFSLLVFALNSYAVPTAKIYKSDADHLTCASGGVVSFESGCTVTRPVEVAISAGAGKAGATAGWAMPSAHSGFTNATIAGLPASQTASTFVIPLQHLRVGDVITSFKVEAQIESAGGTVTLDADLRKVTNVAGDATDASIGAITQVSVTADTKSEPTKTLTTAETVAADEQFYVLLTGTTAASTDVQLLGITVSVTQN